MSIRITVPDFFWFVWVNGLRLLGLLQTIIVGLLGCEALSAHVLGKLGIVNVILMAIIGYLQRNPLLLPHPLLSPATTGDHLS